MGIEMTDTSSNYSIAGTASGNLIDLCNPDPALIKPFDIAVGLSSIQRYSGQKIAPLSVAMHSMMLCDYMMDDGYDIDYCRMALLHDAHEAYLNDITRPVQSAYCREMGSNAFADARRALNDRMDRAIEASLAWDNCDRDEMIDEIDILHDDLSCWEQHNFCTWAQLRNIPEPKLDWGFYHEVLSGSPKTEIRMFLDMMHELDLVTDGQLTDC